MASFAGLWTPRAGDSVTPSRAEPSRAEARADGRRLVAPRRRTRQADPSGRRASPTRQAEAAGADEALDDPDDDAPAVAGVLDDEVDDDVLADESDDVDAGIEELVFDPDPDRASFR